MDVKKTVHSDLLDKETLFEGKIYLSQGVFRWQGETPEKSVLIFDGKVIWNVQYHSVDFPGPIQVARGEVNKKNKQQILLLTLLDPLRFKKSFEVKKLSLEGTKQVFELAPKSDSLSLKKIEVFVEKKIIEKITYVDEVDNKTTLVFSNTDFDLKKDPKLFKYKPEKGAQVSPL